MQKGLKRKWGVDIMKIEIFTLPYFFQYVDQHIIICHFQKNK